MSTPPAPPVPSHDLTLRFQREINRISDSDRNTRKSGLKKLLEQLPWNSPDEAEKESLKFTCTTAIFDPALRAVSDPVEKCRELSIALLGKIVKLLGYELDSNHVTALVSVLCSRINDTPFPEKSEELRFHVVQLVNELCPVVFSDAEMTESFGEDAIIPAIGKALHDPFPDVKKTCSEIVVEVGRLTSLKKIRPHFKILMKGILTNIAHQHYKVRSLSIKALSTVLSSLTTDVSREKEFISALNDHVAPVMTKVVFDRSASPRKAMAVLLGNLISNRINAGSWFDPNGPQAKSILSVQATASSLGVQPNILPDNLGHDSVELDPDLSSHKAASLDTLLLSNLVVLMGDDDESVRVSSTKQLKKVAKVWSIKHGLETQPFIRSFSIFILHNISGAILSSWTTDSKIRQLHALRALILAIQDFCEYTHENDEIENFDGDKLSQFRRRKITSELLTSRLLPQLLDALSANVYDESANIRSAAESCCQAVGMAVASAACSEPNDESDRVYTEGIQVVLDYLIPRARGVLNGMDTAHHRMAALTLLTHILHGIGEALRDNDQEKSHATIVDLCISEVASALADPCLYEFRETLLRESALLLCRSLFKLSPLFSKACLANQLYQQKVLLSLVYLCGRCAHEDPSVPRAAKRELVLFAEAMDPKNPYAEASEKIVNILSVHFKKLVEIITTSRNTNSSDSVKDELLKKPCHQWSPDNAHRAAFEALVRECPRAAWQCHSTVISDVIIPLIQPPKTLVKGSQEEIAATYAAQRGDLSHDGTNADGAVDTRLSMLALLETLLRNGSADWECGKFIATCCDVLFEKAFIPNLAWRAGRVESVARKVALTATYGLLKAGAVEPQSLYKHAPHIVPLLASEMEDQDSSSRHLSCLCLTIVFERLKGGFGEQAVQEIYPRLLKRLDDSDDDIRMAVCTTFKSFLECAPKDVYKGTMIGYTLDQLFIHLDDSDPNIQKCIYDVIVHIAEKIDPQLVLKKAQTNMQTHRTPLMCEAVIKTVEELPSL